MRLPAMFSVSSERPCRNQKPSASTEAQSPCTHTPGMRDQYVSMNLSGSRQKPRVMPGNGLRQTSSPTSPVPTSERAGVVDDVHRHPERRAADRARLDRADRRRREEARADLGAARAVDHRHARAADVLEEPAVRLGVPRLAGRDERAQRREVARRRRRAGAARARASARGRATVTRSCSTVRQSRSGVGQSGAPSAKTIVPPSAPTPTTRPRPHDPAHVGREVHDVALVHVGLVGDLARDRDEEAALHVHDALRLAGRARGVGEEVRRLGVDLQRGQLARVRVEVERREHDVLDATAPRASPLRGSGASAPPCRGARTRAA